MKKKEKILILHNIRSVYNVGAIFRTADAIGIDSVILSGYTPTPVDRFGNTRKDFAKSALGSEQSLKWKYTKALGREIKKLKENNFEIVALEQSPKSLDYKKYKTKKNTAVILGEEVKGISKALLEKADTIIEIPMRGKKESLNVSVATGIVLFRIFDR